MFSRLRAAVLSRAERQASVLTVAKFGGMAISFASSAYAARAMGADEFGLLALALAVLTFLGLFFDFGLLPSMARRLALASDAWEERGLFGAAIVVALGFVSALGLCVFGLAGAFSALFDAALGPALRPAAIVAGAFALPLLVNHVCIGANRVNAYASFVAGQRFLAAVGIFVLGWLGELTAAHAIWAHGLAIALPSLLLGVSLRPRWRSLRMSLRALWKEARSSGFRTYLGRALGMSSYESSRLLISYFGSATQVGYFSLAFSMASPLVIGSQSLAESRFKSFADRRAIAPNLTLVNWLWLAVAGPGVVAVGWAIVHLYLGPEYRPVLGVLLVLVAASMVQGGYVLRNHWLVSNGFGRELLLISSVFGTLNLLCYLAFIPPLGALGAAVATLLTRSYYFLHTRHFYARYRCTQRAEDRPE